MPYIEPLLTTLLFDDNDLQELDGIIVTDLSGMFTGLVRRGDHSTIANRNGQRGNRLPFASFNFQIGILLEGDTHAEMFANLTDLASALAGDDGLGLLERRIDNDAASYTGYTSHYAAGAFAGVDPSLLNTRTGVMDLTFGNLSSRWFTNSDLTVPVPI
jgi:hypothetical protein